MCKESPRCVSRDPVVSLPAKVDSFHMNLEQSFPDISAVGLNDGRWVCTQEIGEH